MTRFLGRGMRKEETAP